MADLRLLIAGAGGRMGRALVRAAIETQGFAVAGALEGEGSLALGKDAGELAGLGALGIEIVADPAPLTEQADAIVDFTLPASSVALAALAAETKLVHVIGTTGLSTADEQKIEAAARKTVVVKSGNMSLGVNILAALVKRVARTLGDEFDIEILEMHHRKKVDAPSGTALLLGKAAAEGRGTYLEKRKVASREGHTGARRSGDIGFAALRGGTVVGDHTVIFAGPSERIELTHKAEDRAIFANGALAAARWGRAQQPGLYSMADVIGLSDD
jgi:4-hydroxy-tetrahydrodipicolinate reductase